MAIVLFTLFFLPSLVMVLFGQSSMAAGLILSNIIVIFYGALNISSVNKINLSRINIFIIFLILLIIHLFVNVDNGVPFNLDKFISSYLALLSLVAGCFVLCSHLCKLSDEKLSFYVRKILIFMVFNALIGIFNIKIFPYMSQKPVGVFSEPSHFALALAPLLIYYSLVKEKGYKYFIIAFFIFGLIIQNLTTIIVVALSLFLVLKIRLSTFLPFLILSSFVFLFIFNNQYFSERLLISSETDNLSVIILLRGWEMANLAAKETYYLGGGFQQFGLIGADGVLSDRLLKLNLGEQNIYDGGSSAAKIIGEFGVFGAIAILLYIYLFLRCIFFLKMGSKNKKAINIFFASCIISLSVELFVRGVGYFSIGFYLAVIAIAGISFEDEYRVN